MLGELGASHTEYYTPDDQADYALLGIFSGPLRTRPQRMFPDGEVSYVGIGAYARQLAGKTFATGILAGLPADRAGLRVGDEIVDVDGKPYRSIESFFGKADQSVILRIRRQPDGPIEPLIVTPQVIEPNEAFLEAMERSARIIDKNGFQSVTFTSGPMPDSPIRGYCCRNAVGRTQGCPGTCPRSARRLGRRRAGLSPAVSGRLPTMSVIGRNGGEEFENVRWGKPVAMLVNGGTRSGKEILAYAFERYRLGPVVGSHTAGAVLGGRAFLMSDDSLLLLAVADVVIDGRRLEGVGVEPTVTVPFRSSTPMEGILSSTKPSRS
jgi:carboxyl-terminal processing protease